MASSSSTQGRAPANTVTRGLRPPILVDTPETFSAMLEALVGEPALALDTESDSLYRYFYKVCLVQVSTASTDYLVDPCLLYTSDAADDLLCVDLGGRRIIK